MIWFEAGEGVAFAGGLCLSRSCASCGAATRANPPRGGDAKPKGLSKREVAGLPNGGGRRCTADHTRRRERPSLPTLRTRSPGCVGDRADGGTAQMRRVLQP
jgi:hypothetical protein